MSSQPYPSAVPASVAVAAGTTAADALAAAGVPLTGPSGAVVVRDLATDALKDLDWVPDEDAEVEPVALRLRRRPRGAAALDRARAGAGRAGAVPGHPARHRPADRERLLLRLPPSTGRSPRRTSTAIEKRMQEIIKAGQRFSRRPISDDEARAELADEPFKLELIGLKGAARGHRGRLGRGRRRRADHLRQPRRADRRAGLDRPVPRPAPADHPADPGVQADALARRRTGAGSEKNPQLQRIYGTAWESRDALKAHLALLAEAEKRDHRRLGAELDLFSFPDEIGSGLAVFHPKGGIVAQGDGGLLPAPARGGRLRVRQHPAHHQGPAVRDLRPPGLVRRRHVPAHVELRGARRRTTT